ncbi:GL26886 [Drosophila persimilis]|uniref:Coiled-coil domain-containing protein 25 n=1 Tax=Drosophila persimilis TaxID=7234 RepID=B4H2R4_DROPE|nr:GL26886 [Drosophila persimilis]
MVFYFKSNIIQPPAILYMGRDKHENEELIRWGWPEDVWFHVNNLSSAHVYLRLKPGQTIDDIPSDVLVDAAQLCKANSIQGNKVNNLEVVYTMWENLKKTPDMEPGQVAYVNEGAVRRSPRRSGNWRQSFAAMPRSRSPKNMRTNYDAGNESDDFM